MMMCSDGPATAQAPAQAASPKGCSAPAQAASPKGYNLHAQSVVPLAPAQRDALLPLILLQEFNGSWELSESFAVALGSTLDNFSPANGASRNSWATALALAFLQAALPAREEEWKLIANKAHEWLKQSIAPMDPMLLVAQARERLENLPTQQ